MNEQTKETRQPQFSLINPEVLKIIAAYGREHGYW